MSSITAREQPELEIVREMMDAWERRDLDTMLSFVSEWATWEWPGA